MHASDRELGERKSPFEFMFCRIGPGSSRDEFRAVCVPYEVEVLVFSVFVLVCVFFLLYCIDPVVYRGAS